jgi:hypothetical protein
VCIVHVLCALRRLGDVNGVDEAKSELEGVVRTHIINTHTPSITGLCALVTPRHSCLWIRYTPASDTLIICFNVQFTHIHRAGWMM